VKCHPDFSAKIIESSPDISVIISSTLQAWRPSYLGSITGRTKEISLLHSKKTSLKARPASFSVGTGDFPWI
jgi:hypothetical protein